MVIGNIYREIGPIDSAYYYLNQVVGHKASVNTVNAAYHALYELSKREKKYQEAIFYNDKFLNGFDSIFDSHKEQELAEMQEKYNQQKLINEKESTKDRKRQKYPKCTDNIDCTNLCHSNSYIQLST